MQPTASNQSSLRCPLNEVFGSRSQVRLLRVLATDHEGPLLPSEAARRAGMTESTARKILNRLVRTGLVEERPNGRGTRFTFSRQGFLAREVARLFEVERDRASQLQQSLKKAVRAMPNPPAMAWVQEFLAGWLDCQEVAVLYSGEPQEEWLAELHDQLRTVEEIFGITLEIRPFSRRELADVDWSKVVMLSGESPVQRDRTSAAEHSASEEQLNPQSSEFSGALVALLEENLSVLRRARDNVRGQLNDQPNGHAHDLWEWQKILDTFSLPRLLNFIGSETPRALRLRECSPFPEVLSREERARLAELAGRPN